MLVQATPSGGRHYFIFLDASYFVANTEDLWGLVGLKHVPGQIEFYPSESHALRLPFGHIPGTNHNPRAWIRFTDDYTRGRIERFNLSDLYDNFYQNRSRSPQPQHHPHSQTQSPQQSPRSRPTPVRVTPSRSLQTPPGSGMMGLPKSDRQATQRYLELLANGPASSREAEELMTLGVRVPGTRTQAMKHLVAHEIFVRGTPAEEATRKIVAWLYDPRHESKDIHSDLAQGRTRVADQAERMVRWYADHKQPPTGRSQQPHQNTTARFSPAELAALTPCVQALPPQDRTHQAHFLLSFLGFAKRHGHPTATPPGWAAAPAVRQVIRRWPGCNHMAYKKWLDHAKTAGLLVMVQEKFQNPHGKGRARTYRLHVPVVAEGEWTLDYNTAPGRPHRCRCSPTTPIRPRGPAQCGVPVPPSERRSPCPARIPWPQHHQHPRRSCRRHQ